MVRHRRVEAACSALALLVVVVARSNSALALQSVRLNAPLPRPRAGAVLDYRISLDGTRVAYRADQVFDNVVELISVPVDGSAPAVRLHAPQGPSSQADVLDVEVGAGGRAVFRADLGTNETFELYSATLTGTTSPTVLSGTMVAGGDVFSFRMTPDGSHAVYLADAVVDNRRELFSVPVDGSSPPLRLDPEDREAAGLYRITPAGDAVVYSTESGIDRERLYVVPLDASALPLLLADSGESEIGTNTYFGDLTIAGDGLHAAYVHVDALLDRGDAHRAGLFGLTLDGSQPPAQLHLEREVDGFPSHALAGSRVVYREPEGDLYTLESDGSERVLLASNEGAFALGPDSSKVAFLAGTFGTSTLYVAPVDGSSPPTVLAGPGELESPRFSTDSDLVLFIGVVAPTAFRGLFAVPVTGGTPLLVNGPVIDGERGVQDFAIGPQGGTILYREDRVADDVFELFAVEPGFEPRRLSGPLGEWRDVSSYRVSLDGTRVVYLADQDTEATDELFGVATDGSSPRVRLNPEFAEGDLAGRVDAFRVTPDESQVAYVAAQESPFFLDLFSTTSGGRGAPVRLTEPLSDRGDVGLDLALSPSGNRVVFSYRLPPTGTSAELYAGTTDGTGTAVKLDASISGFEPPFVIDPGDSFVVYRARDPELLDSSVLRRADLDGDPSGFNLASSLFGSILDFQLTPDASAVIYRAAQDAPAQIDLYRVASGGGAALRLNTPPFAGADVVAFRLTPDGSRVVYRGTQQTSSQELFSVASSGSGPVVKLNGALAPSGSVLGFTVTPLGVLYNATQVASNRNELFAAPFDGSSAALRLTLLPPGNLGVQPDFTSNAGGTLAFYRADATTPARYELFVVPTDASASPTKLSGPLATGGSVVSFALSPDGSSVVYLADQRADEVFELFRAPVSGGPATALVTLPALADVTAYRIAPDSTWVVYLADAVTNDVPELWRVRLDGSAGPERVNPSLPFGRDVMPDFVPLSSGGIVYRCDLHRDQAFELFCYVDVELDDALLPAKEPTRTRGVVR